MKKSIKKIMSLLLAGTMLVTPVTASAFTDSSRFDSRTFTHQDRFINAGIQQGIDVSYHNGTLNWSTIKAAGVDFAILRAAYRGYGDEGTLVRDTKFAEYIQGAQSQGIPVGAYIYSQAISTAEAVQEANYILNIVRGYSLDLPIVFDYEFAGVKTGRLDSAWADGDIDKNDMTNIALAFCNTIKNAGYDAMVYANKTFLNTNLDHARIENAGYKIWLAHYTTYTDYKGAYNIWQYTSTGKIPGIANKVFDCNFMYSGAISSSAPKIAQIANQTYTGSEIRPSVTVTYGNLTLSEGVDYEVTYQNNIEIGTATVSVTGLNQYAGFINLYTSFDIVPAPVTEINYSSVTTNKAEMYWPEVEGATGYIVQTIKNGRWTNSGTYITNSGTVSGLMPGCYNPVRVAAYVTVAGKNYIGQFCNYIRVKTLIGAVNPKTSAISSTYITLTWDKQDASNGYEVYKYDSAKKKYVLYKTITSGNTNTCKVTGLSASKKYYFRVRAFQNDNGEKNLGAFGTTLTQYTSVSKPKIKSATSSSKKKIKASWAKVSGASGYQVMWSTYSNFSKNYKTKSVTSKYLSKTVTTAQSKKYYYVRVRAYKTVSGKKVYSQWSSTKKVKTK